MKFQEEDLNQKSKNVHYKILNYITNYYSVVYEATHKDKIWEKTQNNNS